VNEHLVTDYVPRIQRHNLNWTYLLPESVKIDTLALIMDCKSGDQSDCASSSCSGSEYGSYAEEECDEIQQLECNELQISTNGTKWSCCEDWHQVMETNKSFFQGRVVSAHMGARYNPDHKRNKDLISLLDVVYVVSYKASQEFRFSHPASMHEVRWMEACCFMLPGSDPILQGLIYALLDDEQLFTSVVLTNYRDLRSSLRVSPDSYPGEFKSRWLASLSDSKSWDIPKPLTASKVYTDLYRVAQDVEAFDCKAMSDAKPAIFWIRARDYETDILKCLLSIISKEIERCDPMLKRFEVPEELCIVDTF
jgi:hypothetical protein